MRPQSCTIIFDNADFKLRVCDLLSSVFSLLLSFRLTTLSASRTSLWYTQIMGRIPLAIIIAHGKYLLTIAALNELNAIMCGNLISNCLEHFILDALVEIDVEEFSDNGPFCEDILTKLVYDSLDIRCLTHLIMFLVLIHIVSLYLTERQSTFCGESESPEICCSHLNDLLQKCECIT